MKKIIGIFCYDDVFALDVFGPIGAFTSSFSSIEKETLYEVALIGIDGKAVKCESGAIICPHFSTSNSPELDTLIVPGGRGIRENKTSKELVKWLQKDSNKIRRIASVCTGIYGLAAAGLLDGKNATTHWRFIEDVKTRFPNVNIDSDAIYIKDENVYTSAGATAGIDLTLELIKEDFGPSVALSVARELVVYFKRPGGQNQYSEPLKFQLKSADEFADLIAWIKCNLHRNLSVSDIAEKVSLCPRHFNRKFKTKIGCTPAAFLEQLRLHEACYKLTMSTDTIHEVAESVGFRSADVFRRSFERMYGISPSSYSARFNSICNDKRL